MVWAQEGDIEGGVMANEGRREVKCGRVRVWGHVGDGERAKEGGLELLRVWVVKMLGLEPNLLTLSESVGQTVAVELLCLQELSVEKVVVCSVNAGEEDFEVLGSFGWGKVCMCGERKR